MKTPAVVRMWVTTRLLPGGVFLLALLAAAACASRPLAPAGPIEVAFHDVREAPVSDRPSLLLDTAGGLFFAGRNPDLERLWVSRDEGTTWVERMSLPLVPRVWAAHEGCPDLHRIELLGEGLFHLQGLAPGARRSRITDDPTIAIYGRALVIGPRNRMGVVWIDRGRGWPELMFSQSLDHGSSWSPAVRINTESRRKEMATPVLLSHAGGWVVVWTENRDAHTLFDLYGSFSPDGQRWGPSRRLNDDQEPAFSVGPDAVDDEGKVHIIAQDYRDLNRFRDRDANIYYAGMDVKSGGAEANVRVNDVTDGPQWAPALARDARSGSLVAVWVDARHRLRGEIYASISADGGASWSPNRRINVNFRPEWIGTPLVAPRMAGGVYVTWQQARGSSSKAWMRLIVPGECSEAPQPDISIPASQPGPLIRPLARRDLLARERFESDSIGDLRPLAGSWIVRHGALLGFGYSAAYAELAQPPLANFVLEGRFRLDPSQHIAAQLFLRAHPVPGEPGAFEGYQIRNHFRMGVLLSRAWFTTGRYKPPTLVSEPLEDRWLPLRQDTGYTFRVVVQGRKLDYWLDDAWVLSADGLDPHPGAIMLATDAMGPVEWDDLSLYALD